MNFPTEIPLKVSNITKFIQGKKILENVNFSVKKGHALGLIGPNGAGKTTTIQCITGILSPDNGSVDILGKTYTSTNSVSIDYKIKFHLGIMFDVPMVLDYLTGYEYLSTIGDVFEINRKEAADRIKRLLQFFQLKNYAHTIIDNYSRGMKKKLEIASLILHNPDLYILDEPFESLDALTGMQVKNLMIHLKSLEKSFLITSHLLPYVEEICDDIVILDNGKPILRSEQGTLTEHLPDSLEKTLFNTISTGRSEAKPDISSLDWL